MKMRTSALSSFDTQTLAATLSSMKKLYIENPTRAVRSKSFITLFQNYCADQLRLRGVETNGRIVKTEEKIPVRRGRVEADVGVFNRQGEPLLVVDIRSQMSSLGKNFNNYIRMKAGEVESLHAQFPDCIVGLVYIHPHSDLPTRVPVSPVGSFNYRNAAAQLESLILMEDTTERLSKYEFVAYCVVDFVSDPPALSPHVPEQDSLRFEHFFDDVVSTLDSI
jgi:hypothetical protein